MSANQPYAQFPDHALHNVSQAVLEAGWRAVGAEPTGDAMLPGLRDWLRDWLRGELLDELRGKLQHHLVERDDPCADRGADHPCDVALRHTSRRTAIRPASPTPWLRPATRRTRTMCTPPTKAASRYDDASRPDTSVSAATLQQTRPGPRNWPTVKPNASPAGPSCPR